MAELENLYGSRSTPVILEETGEMDKMRKICAVLSAGLCLMLAGCAGGSGPEDTAGAFWQAMEEGDLQKAAGFVSEEAEEYMQSLSGSVDSLVETAESYDLSAETAGKIQTYTSNIMKITYGGHAVQGSAEISENEYEVTVNVRSVDPVSFKNAMEQLDYAAAADQYKDEIMQIMNEDGINKAYARLFDIIFEYLNDNLSSITGKLTYNDNPVVMTVKKNEDGRWLITGVNYKRLKSLASCFTDEFLQSIPFGMNAEESASTGL